MGDATQDRYKEIMDRYIRMGKPLWLSTYRDIDAFAAGITREEVPLYFHLQVMTTAFYTFKGGHDAQHYWGELMRSKLDG